MHKLLAIALFSLPVLAHADAPPPAAPATVAEAPMAIELKLDVGKDQRHYSMRLVEQECGIASAKGGPAFDDEVKICARPSGTKIQLHVDWRTREGDHELRNDSTMIVARGGAFDLGSDGAKLHVAVQ